jgi:hypothetical protein
MIHPLLRAVAVAAIGLSLQSAAHAAPVITTYGSVASFTAGAPGAALETFTAHIAPGLTNSPDSYDFGPFVATKAYSVHANITGPTSGPGGAWRGRPTTELPDEFLFDGTLSAWGASFETSIGQEDDLGISLLILVEGSWHEVGTVGVGADPDDVFFGFASSIPFSAVRVVSYSDRPRDAYRLDNMRYLAMATEPTAIVPEPASFALFGLGLLGIAVVRRRHRGMAAGLSAGRLRG